MNKTKIEYCTHTWNPMTGCRHGCDFCYAAKICKRYGRSFEPALHPDRLDQPAKMKKPCVVFVCDMGDIFSPGTRTAWRDRVKAAADAAPWHTYLWLTKNPRYDESWIRSNWWLGASITGPEDAWKREVMEGENIWYSYEPLFGVPDPENVWNAQQVVIGRATNHKSEWSDTWARQLTQYYQSVGTKVYWKNNIKADGPRDLCWKLYDPESKIRKQVEEATNGR